MNYNDLSQPEVTSGLKPEYVEYNRSQAVPHYTIRDTPFKFTCGTCKEELNALNVHSCSPYLLKRIEALEAIVNRFICDGK